MKRRNFVKVAAASGVSGMAGCLGGENADSDYSSTDMDEDIRSHYVTGLKITDSRVLAVKTDPPFVTTTQGDPSSKTVTEARTLWLMEGEERLASKEATPVPSVYEFESVSLTEGEYKIVVDGEPTSYHYGTVYYYLVQPFTVVESDQSLELEVGEATLHKRSEE